jgi:hypothetical protein
VLLLKGLLDLVGPGVAEFHDDLAERFDLALARLDLKRLAQLGA